MENSRLKDLIDTYCSNGVEYKTINDICLIQKGVQLNKELLKDDGLYPVINGGINPSGYWDEYNFKDNLITISQGGASAGYVNYIETPFWAGAHCYVVVNCNECVDYKFLYHFLKMKQRELMKSQYGGGIPSLSLSVINSLRIPVPPLHVQEEIVRILDTFTELKAELDAELDARKKQYTFYRDQLLNFDEQLKIENFSIEKLINDGLVSTITPSFKIKREQYGKFGLTPIVSQEIEYISGYCDKKDERLPSGNYVCFGDHSEHIKFVDFEFAQGADGLKIMKTDENKLLSKYLYHAINSFYRRHDNYERHFKYLASTIIPVPSLDIQHRIVDILDNFDSICSDLSIGLPAEIAAREKQYEYYRDLIFDYAANGLDLSRTQQNAAERSRTQQNAAERSRTQQNR